MSPLSSWWPPLSWLLTHLNQGTKEWTSSQLEGSFLKPCTQVSFCWTQSEGGSLPAAVFIWWALWAQESRSWNPSQVFHSTLRKAENSQKGIPLLQACYWSKLEIQCLPTETLQLPICFCCRNKMGSCRTHRLLYIFALDIFPHLCT